MTATVSGRAVATVNAEMLKGIALFQGLGEPALQMIARELPTSHVEVGKVIIQAGLGMRRHGESIISSRPHIWPRRYPS